MADCTRCRFFMSCEPPKQYYYKLSGDTCDTFSPVPNEDNCVCCGRTIPEGRIVCPICENNRKEIKMSLIEKLKAIKVRKKADKEAIAEAIQFINKIQEYNEIQKYAFSMIGFEPILHTENEEKGEG